MPENNLAQDNNFAGAGQRSSLEGVPSPISTVKYAGFWARFAASFIDGLVLIIPAMLFGLIINLGTSGNTKLFLSDFSGLIVSWVYAILMISKYQATLGKKALGIMVVSDKSENLTLGQIIIRETIGKFISAAILFMGYIMVGFTAKKQGLHDKIAGTAVVYKDPNKNTSVWIIVIAVLFVFLFIGGILASIVLVSLNSARYKAYDAQIESGISSAFSSAVLYQDDKGSLLGFSPKFLFQVPSCSEKPIVNISPDGKKMAIFEKLCSAEGKYFCNDIDFKSGKVDEGYARSGKFSCFGGNPAEETAKPVTEAGNRDTARKDDLGAISSALFAYFNEHEQYPIAPATEKTSDTDSSVYKALGPQYIASGLPVDPQMPSFYYGYKSIDRKNYELTARLENLSDERCALQNNICIYRISRLSAQL